MKKIRKQAAGVFVLAAFATTLTPVATANAAGPDLECIKKAAAAYVNHVVNGGPVPLPCG